MARFPVYSRHRRTEPPCKGCEERFVGCHSGCDKYKSWKAQELKRSKEAYQVYITEKVANDYVVQKIKDIKLGKR